jgi:prepilin-type processing-associated H-X9-DG protein
MSFQAYLDKIEEKTGVTPRALVEQAKQHGYDAPDVKAGVICEWLKADYDLGRGHAMALVQVIKNGAVISDKHVGTNGSHSDASNVLWLDGKATNPAK